MPFLGSRVEQVRDFTCHWVNTREIWSLVAVAKVAGKGQVLWIIAATMLLGDDVLDMKSDAIILLVNVAVFAAIVSAGTYSRSGLSIHVLGRDLAIRFGSD